MICIWDLLESIQGLSGAYAIKLLHLARFALIFLVHNLAMGKIGLAEKGIQGGWKEGLVGKLTARMAERMTDGLIVLGRVTGWGLWDNGMVLDNAGQFLPGCLQGCSGL